MIAKDGNKWKLDIQPGGRGQRRYRKWFDSKAEAQRFEQLVISKHAAGLEWNKSRRDTRRLSDLISRWYELHGISLKDGERRRRIMLRLAESMGNPDGSSFTPGIYSAFRRQRIADGISPSTANHDLAYLKALFNELDRLGEWTGENPLKRVRPIRVDERELSYLTQEQIKNLLVALEASRNKDALLVTKLCLATGARWSEAEGLTADRLFPDRVVYSGTKSGKVRVVPVSISLSTELGVRTTGRLFQSCYAAFRKATERAGIVLPAGQMAHVLRHTFSSHFMMNGGDILTLQKILGHSDLRMTLRYAHLAPDHLRQAVSCNPLTIL